MGVDYNVCDECGNTYCDCEEHEYCSSCGRSFCGYCKEDSGVLYDEEKYKYVSCKYCRKEDFDLDICYKKALELLKITDSQIKDILRKENK